jgi:sulfatase maturation enzyme AslB (radical SAM superfamily)
MPAIEITTKIGCDVNCSYCPQATLINAYSNRSKDFEMTFDVFKKCLSKLPSEVDVHFSGMCEPWLNSETTKMVLYAHQRGHAQIVYTTLMGMNLSDLKLLETVPFKVFEIHIPSLEASQQNIIVDDQYLALLNRILKSRIPASFRLHGKSVHPRLSSLLKDKIVRVKTYTRAGNLTTTRSSINRRKGTLDCLRGFRQSVLLPNGEVVLCCMDYGLKHVLGNLITSHYEDLFLSEEFQKIQSGRKDDSIDILCRYCDGFAYKLNPFTKAYFYSREFLKRFGKLKKWNL